MGLRPSKCCKGGGEKKKGKQKKKPRYSEGHGTTATALGTGPVPPYYPDSDGDSSVARYGQEVWPEF